MKEFIEIWGAREHNLKDIDLKIPRNSLVVFTGISGSGKSSLAFDTLFAEGQRRYLESFSAYARNFIGTIERPDVDKIDGLSPVIAIEQKTTSRNPRSTIGTVTEIYDFLRLLFARTARAYSYVSGKKMVKQSQDQIQEYILEYFNHKKITLLSPLIKGRKGHYRELFTTLTKQGFSKVRVDGSLIEIHSKLQLDRYSIHDIELVIDRILVSEEDKFRLSQSLKTALQLGKGSVEIIDEEGKNHFFSKNLTDVENGISYEEPAPNAFSFNSPYGWCPACEGLGVKFEVTEDSIFPNQELSVEKGGIAPLGVWKDNYIFKQVESVLKSFKFSLKTPIKDLSKDAKECLLYGIQEKIPIPSKTNPHQHWASSFNGIIRFLESHRENASESFEEWLKEFMESLPCPECKGTRLKKESLYFKIGTKNIAELAQLDIEELKKFFETVESHFSEKENLIAKEVLKEIRKRIQFLVEIGLEYLSLDRPFRTLSGGETQRIRLATQIGTQLTGVLYILDEPSIGLHQRDNQKLIQSLKSLRDLENTVIVVEHDEEMMLAADFIVDIGPGAGRHGGQIVALGTPQEFLKMNSLTATYLSKSRNNQDHIPRKGSGKYIELKNAQGNNLKNITLKLPLGTFIGITGVSGSGKSTLIHETLYPLLHNHINKTKRKVLPYTSISGIEHIDKVIEVDQSPIGRTPRSNPATYTGLFTEIRTLFCQLPEAKIRGYKPGRFSFNVTGGRCETCKGGGVMSIEMEFLPDVQVLCETCKGKRYNRETLEVRYKGKSISDVLDMTVEQALSFFESYPLLLRKLKVLDQVGLNYISLGQHATTLSGGEAQRIKLAEELSKKDTGKTLYILDEPTTGLHFKDIELLTAILQKLVEKGNTVIVIEHNLDMIRLMDYVVDLGPEGGRKGGEIVVQGTPNQVKKNKNSYTGKFL